ncbi:hypothetical protein H6G06_21855 [Anabaena sphaerica FACHB-251]|uniref:Uncharacterized protein n=1 Tax=Anabaena sphaerica FACHB-251 TaxID=2692883 RepID=A0A927A342_9NOST|nr:hypothetical protein [Anabaena sphaerica]MBD2296048.1 hypothetical protein [Anabaena sphaerica FACHB-251]
MLKTRAQKHGNYLQAEIKAILQQITKAENKKIRLSEKRIAAFKEWIESHKNINFLTLSDEAISRESIYDDRG